MDSLVSFLYTSSYPVDLQAAKMTTLHHHTILPPGTTPTSFPLDMNATEYQICMYGIAEFLSYPALMSYAYDQLASYFVLNQAAPHHVAHLIKLVFAPANSLSRKCKDEVGAIKGLGTAAVLVHEKRYWSGREMDEFRDLLANELEQDAWKEYRACYKQIRDANLDLLGSRSAAQDIGSLVSGMNNVVLTRSNKPDLVEELHLLFDVKPNWGAKALRS